MRAMSLFVSSLYFGHQAGRQAGRHNVMQALPLYVCMRNKYTAGAIDGRCEA
jgi:hypothetical protein